MDDRLVLIYFWANWCSHCSEFAPVLNRIIADYIDVLNVQKVNIDMEPEVSHRYGIKGIPTVILIRDDKIIGRFSGYRTYSETKSFIEEHLK